MKLRSPDAVAARLDDPPRSRIHAGQAGGFPDRDVAAGRLREVVIPIRMSVCPRISPFLHQDIIEILPLRAPGTGTGTPDLGNEKQTDGGQQRLSDSFLFHPYAHPFIDPT
ncbi:hypothetical protein D3C76_1185840 [compost metagenome]